MALRADNRQVARQADFGLAVQLPECPGLSRGEIAQGNLVSSLLSHPLPPFVKHPLFCKRTHVIGASLMFGLHVRSRMGSESLKVNEAGKNAQKRAKGGPWAENSRSAFLRTLNLEL
jgi:hypothetical protein